MRKLRFWLAIVASLALALAGVAVAKHKHGKTHTDTALATFTVTQVSVKERTCTGTDGDYRHFRAVYRGTATGDPRLTGELVIRGHGLINQTTGMGTTRGTVHLKADDHRIAKGRFAAVNTNRSILHGLVTGWVRDRTAGGLEEQDGSGWLTANIKATFNADGTILSGQLGGTAGDPRTPAVIQRGGCSHGKKTKRKR